MAARTGESTMIARIEKRPPRRAAQVREETPLEGCNIVTQPSMLRCTSYVAMHDQARSLRMPAMRLRAGTPRTSRAHNGPVLVRASLSGRVE